MKKELVATVILAALSSNAHAEEKKSAVEKCYGVARAEKNDCAAKDGSHSCAGLAAKDADPVNWVYVPKGLCARLAGSVKG